MTRMVLLFLLPAVVSAGPLSVDVTGPIYRPDGGLVPASVSRPAKIRASLSNSLVVSDEDTTSTLRNVSSFRTTVTVTDSSDVRVTLIPNRSTLGTVTINPTGTSYAVEIEYHGGRIVQTWDVPCDVLPCPDLGIGSIVVPDPPTPAASDNALLKTGDAATGVIEFQSGLILTPMLAPTSPVTGQMYMGQDGSGPWAYDGTAFVDLSVDTVGAGGGGGLLVEDFVATAPIALDTSGGSVTYSIDLDPLTGLETNNLGELAIDSSKLTPTHANLQGIGTDDHHARDHAARHIDGSDNLTSVAPIVTDTSGISLTYGDGLTTDGSNRLAVNFGETSTHAATGDHTHTEADISDLAHRDATLPLVIDSNNVSLQYDSTTLGVGSDHLGVISENITPTWDNVQSKPTLVESVTAGDGLNDSGTATDPILDVNTTAPMTTASDSVSLSYSTGLTVSGGNLVADFGEGPNKVTEGNDSRLLTLTQKTAITDDGGVGNADGQHNHTESAITDLAHRGALIPLYIETNDVSLRHDWSTGLVESSGHLAIDSTKLTPTHANVQGVGPDDHHAEDHAARHLSGGGDPVTVQSPLANDSAGISLTFSEGLTTDGSGRLIPVWGDTARITGTGTEDSAGTLDYAARADHVHELQITAYDSDSLVGKGHSIQGGSNITVSLDAGIITLNGTGGGGWDLDTDSTTGNDYITNSGTNENGAVIVRDNDPFGVYNLAGTVGVTVDVVDLIPTVDTASDYIDVTSQLRVSDNVSITGDGTDHVLFVESGTLATDRYSFRVTGTRSAGTLAPLGASMRWDTTGSSTFLYGLDVGINAGATAQDSRALSFFNALSNGTGNQTLNNRATYGIFGDAQGSGTGDKVGVMAQARGGTEQNYGMVGSARFTTTGDNVGVLGFGRNTGGGNEVGVYAALDSSVAAEPPIAFDAALLANNGDRATHIAIFLDDGVEVGSVEDGGDLRIDEVSGSADTDTKITLGSGQGTANQLDFHMGGGQDISFKSGGEIKYSNYADSVTAISTDATGAGSTAVSFGTALDDGDYAILLSMEGEGQAYYTLKNDVGFTINVTQAAASSSVTVDYVVFDNG